MNINKTDEYNDRIEQWTKNLMNDLRQELDRLDVKHSKYSPNKTPLRKAIKPKFVFHYEVNTNPCLLMFYRWIFLKRIIV